MHAPKWVARLLDICYINAPKVYFETRLYDVRLDGARLSCMRLKTIPPSKVFSTGTRVNTIILVSAVVCTHPFNKFYNFLVR